MNLKAHFMKKILSLWAVLMMGFAMVVLTGCPPSDPPVLPPDTIPEMYAWHMTAWDAGSGEAEIPNEVHLKFRDDNTFFLWQDFDGRIDLFTGTYTLSGTTLSGTYTDGESWAYSYTVGGTDNLITDAANDATLTLTAVEDSAYKTTYKAQLLGEALAAMVAGPEATTRSTGRRFL